ncbi:3-deoxy-7-phosphoheptulonate synthase [Bifidobacterium tsurumiense]|uniref:Phospho-2-dehydro-3-deoxyheptonate aldolase n=1 Tax=Bifidobacterium tsurumiense TaxID=356829 RepID=A0A087ECF1_9BIFI|nr:3-deoxy-7-phosphoheptulonate synthase [Bifidobacterium tsurumiense]KFJ05452.1 3-deoxy-7-phosphoheptulonate synthase [Bifidobacterium tsurumiense]MDY4677891.1 3-deoxy-7-phosphoheptulonate synthase [Bifidobacterium tsurumiense]MSS12383.1 3-deoxy-7-phosphoheptulonate synthase [Bifidobacterium tsurumiense]
MAGLRGPDSSEDEHRFDEYAVLPETVDVNIRQLDPIPAPRAFLREIPLTDEMSSLVLSSRQAIRNVLRGKDDRLLVIVGPCSIHDPKAAHEYASRLAQVNERLKDRLLIVMRVYFEKPRTTIGWKGLINDPDLDGRCNIRKGMWLARKVLTDVLSQGLPAATEWLDPITPQYFCDLVSWGAIGARNTESQVHRELASGLSMPIGFKNSTDGSVKAAADSCYTSAFEHHFLSINLDGRVISAETKGNPDCHLVLRGSSKGPNYDENSVQEALAALRASKATGPSEQGVVIDAAHGNSGKDEVREAEVVEEIAARLAAGERGILGVMMESFLEAGNQKPAPLEQLTYGKSITDACIPWDRTEALLNTLAQAVSSRRAL